MYVAAPPSSAAAADGSASALAAHTARTASGILLSTVIVSLHAALGAALGSSTRSRTAAIGLGIVSHLAADAVPHRDFRSRRFELASGLAAIGLLAARCGAAHPATLGAVAATLPDVEHVLPLPRPGGSKLLHGARGWHRGGSFPPEAQLLLAGALLVRSLRECERQWRSTS